MIRSPLMTVMVDAVMKAAKGLRRDFGEVENLQVSRKGPGDFVSAADHKAETVIRESLQKARPDYGFVMEESGVIEGRDGQHRWHIDPLDGTANFLHGIPHFAISVGLERDGALVAGVVYDPIKDELFIAEKGKGAYLNNRRLRVSGRIVFDDCLVATGMAPHLRKNRNLQLDKMSRVIAKSAGVRWTGSAALDLAYLAAGRFDAFWSEGLKSWDMAAGLVLVKEAGGFFSDLAGKDLDMDQGSVAAGNQPAHQALLAALKE